MSGACEHTPMPVMTEKETATWKTSGPDLWQEKQDVIFSRKKKEIVNIFFLSTANWDNLLSNLQFQEM